MIQIYTNPILTKILEEKNITYTPAYGGESTGLDLYLASNDQIQIDVNNVLIPTGLHIKLPPAHTALLLGRGSIHKTSLGHRAGVIDPGYSGEIFISAYSIDRSLTVLNPGDKLPWQLVVFQTPNTFEIVDHETFHNLHLSSNRQSGMLGSSNS